MMVRLIVERWTKVITMNHCKDHKRWLAAEMRALDMATKRGDTRVVRQTLHDRDLMQLASDAGEPDLSAAAATMDAAKTWLKEADVFEAIHGPGSKLDPDHPFNRDRLPRILERVAQRKL